MKKSRDFLGRNKINWLTDLGLKMRKMKSIVVRIERLI